MTDYKKTCVMVLFSAILFSTAFLTGCHNSGKNNESSSTPPVTSTVLASEVADTSSHITKSDPASSGNKEKIIALVEKDDPYKLKPTMSAKDRYDLRK